MDPPVHPELRDLLESQARSDLQVLQEPPDHQELRAPSDPHELRAPSDHQELRAPSDPQVLQEPPGSQVLQDLQVPKDPKVFKDSPQAQWGLLLDNLYPRQWEDNLYPWESRKMLKISSWHWEKDFLKIQIVKKLSFSLLFKRTRWDSSLFHKISSAHRELT